jgi:DNA repair exonuclease SbcCD ATPase subunit
MARKLSKAEGEEQGSSLSPRDQQVQERLLKLKDQHRVLHERKIATERDRLNLEDRLRELRAQAEREYGTSDIEELRRLLDERREENDRMVEEYQRHVEDIQGRLKEIDESGEEAGSPEA